MNAWAPPRWLSLLLVLAPAGCGGGGGAFDVAQAETTGTGSAATDPDDTASPPPPGTSSDGGTESGGPPRDPPPPTRPRPDLGGEPPVEPPPGFVVVTEQAGLVFDPGDLATAPFCLLDDLEDTEQSGDFCIPERFLGSAAAGDYDGDGFVDLLLTRLRAPDLLMRNQGDGTFVDATEAAGLQLDAATGGAVWADIDGDGDLDLLTTAVGAPRNFLYINEGDGTFTEDADARGFAVQTGWPHSGMGIGVGDYDLDGWLDVFVADWHPDDPMGPKAAHNRLLHNLGPDAPGVFEDVTDAMGIALRPIAPQVDAKAGEYGFAPAFVDLDGDRWPELSLAADFGTSRLWWNEGGHSLLDTTFASGLGTERNGMGSAFGDYDGDGDLDWFVSAIATPTFPTLGNRMYRNDGQRQFTDVTDALGLRDGGWGWGAAMFDVEHDGDLDVALAAGWPSTEFVADPVRLWINEGEGPWPDRATDLGIVFSRQGRGLVPLDYDRDGDLDVLVLSNTELPALLRNDVADGGFLVVQVEGHGGNRHGIGAVVRVQTSPDGPWQVRHVGVGSHFLGQAETHAHFGLGPGDAPVTRVQVHWPATDETRELTEVARDQWLVVEPPR